MFYFLLHTALGDEGNRALMLNHTHKELPQSSRTTVAFAPLCYHLHWLLGGTSQAWRSSDRETPSPGRLARPGRPGYLRREATLLAAYQHHRGPDSLPPRRPLGPHHRLTPAFPVPPPPSAPRALRRGAGPAPPDRLAGKTESGPAAKDRKKPQPRAHIFLTRIYRQQRRHLSEREGRRSAAA